MSFKKKSYKRPSYKSRYVKHKRHHPSRALSTTFWPKDIKLKDTAMMKMTTQLAYTSGGSGTIVMGTLQPFTPGNANPLDYAYFTMNDIVTPGLQNSIVSFTFPPATGYSIMSGNYNYWKVRSCAIDFYMEFSSMPRPDGSTATLMDAHVACIPMSTNNNTLGPTLPWTQWRLQPYWKEKRVNISETGSTRCHLKHFVPINKINGYTTTTMDLTTGSTTGSGSTPPTMKPTWWFMTGAPNYSESQEVRYTLTTKMTFYVQWIDRKMQEFKSEPPLTTETKEEKLSLPTGCVEAGLTEEDDEKDFMSVSELGSGLSLSSSPFSPKPTGFPSLKTSYK